MSSFIIHFISYSQSTLEGVVKDSTGVIEFANVLLKDSNNRLAKGKISNEKGQFSFIVGTGTYSLEISFIGYRTFKKLIEIESENVEEIIILQKSALSLKEVELTKNKPLLEQKSDRLVFNVENSISSEAGDAIDILKVTPNLLVLDNSFTVLGRDGVDFLQDGRKLNLSGDELINYLSTLESEDISKIEVITTPPSKYDAGGNIGLVNIILKKTPLGDFIRGSVNSIYEQKTFTTGRYGVNLVANWKKWKSSLNSNYANGSYRITEDHTTDFTNQFWFQENRRRQFRDQFSTRFTIDRDISNNTSIGFIYTGILNNPSNNETDQININDINGDSTNFFSNTTASRNQEISSHAFNTHLQVKLDSLNKNISFNVDQFFYNKETQRSFDNESFINNENIVLSAINRGDLNINVTTANIDLELPYKWGKLETGAKVAFINNESVLDNFDTVLGDQENEFDYNENIQALYISAEKDWEKWSVKFGLRSEYTQTEGFSLRTNQIFVNDYFRIFPTLYVLHKLNKKSSLSLSYSKRVGRPSFNMLDPFRVFQNQFSIIQGNPFIQPEFVDSVDLNYSLNNNFTAAFNFFYLEDGKSQVSILDPETNINEVTFSNFFDAVSFQGGVTYRYKKVGWWENYSSLNLSYLRTFVFNSLDSPDIGQTSLIYTTTNTFALNKTKTLFLESNFSYQSPRVINILEIEDRVNLNIGIRFLLLNKNLRGALSFLDVFRSNQFESTSLTNGVVFTSDNYFDNQTLKFSLSYRFGNSRISQSRIRRQNRIEAGRAN